MNQSLYCVWPEVLIDIGCVNLDLHDLLAFLCCRQMQSKVGLRGAIACETVEYHVSSNSCVLWAGAARGGEALVGRAVAKRFGAANELFKGKVGYYAPRLCPKA